MGAGAFLAGGRFARTWNWAFLRRCKPGRWAIGWGRDFAGLGGMAGGGFSRPATEATPARVVKCVFLNT